MRILHRVRLAYRQNLRSGAHLSRRVHRGTGIGIVNDSEAAGPLLVSSVVSETFVA